jgi:stage II sporulation protein E
MSSLHFDKSCRKNPLYWKGQFGNCRLKRGTYREPDCIKPVEESEMGEWLRRLPRVCARITGRQDVAEKPFGLAGYAGAYLMPEQEQLKKYADAFYGIARLFQDMPCQKERMGDEGIQAVIAEVQDSVCADCGQKWRCWENDYFESCRMVYEMACAAESEGITRRLVKESGLQCGHAGTVAELVAKSCIRVRQELLWRNRLLELRTAVGEQILQTAELMERTADGFEEVTELHAGSAGRLSKNLACLHVRLEDIRIFRCMGERIEVFLTLRARREVCVSAKTVAEILSDSLGMEMCPARNCQAAVLRERGNFHFVPDTRYQLLCGSSGITRAGELVSGDNYALWQKETGQVVMSLADGMGSGVEACRESEKVIELVEQFLEAGFPQETAVRMINSCMLLQGQETVFSTIDLCMVDLYHATCDMIKSGAAATFLKHGDEIEVICADTFPSGVLWQSDYTSIHRELHSGDVIVMVTDGVLGAWPDEMSEEGMKDLIRRAACPNAREYARRIMERVCLMQQFEAWDDMTVLVGSIWKKEQKS